MLGTSTAHAVLREHDPDMLLALQAANISAMRMKDQEFERLASHIIGKLGEAMKG